MGGSPLNGRARGWACLFAAIALLSRWTDAWPGCFVGPAIQVMPKLQSRSAGAGVDTLPAEEKQRKEPAAEDEGVVPETPRRRTPRGTVIRRADPQGEATKETPQALKEEPTKEEPANLALGAGAGVVATLAVSALGPLLVKSGVLAPLKEAVTSIATPLSESYAIPLMTFGIPNWLLHWSHGGNTGSALLLIAGAGVAGGLDIRRRRLEKQPPAGPQIVDHSTLMTSALVVALVGASGGIASMRYDQQPLLESPHAWAAILSVMFLVANALVSTTFSGAKKATDSGPSPRDLHAQLGSAWIASVAVSAVMGLSLGTSYEGLTAVDPNQNQPIPGSYFYGGQDYDPRLQLTRPDMEP
eukprot:TRINITY_DN84341_c0_g1_i1.p1 TRINITY_DN84341_c0_g1~~TRINITY_DN84341_c0_g1_i1.p1  ORF type:complete len:357 (+),score=68.39 TRINITY_DN84341_c0_g1_i1:237-1307(+)